MTLDMDHASRHLSSVQLLHKMATRYQVPLEMKCAIATDHTRNIAKLIDVGTWGGGGGGGGGGALQ